MVGVLLEVTLMVGDGVGEKENDSVGVAVEVGANTKLRQANNTNTRRPTVPAHNMKATCMRIPSRETREMCTL